MTPDPPSSVLGFLSSSPIRSTSDSVCCEESIFRPTQIPLLLPLAGAPGQVLGTRGDRTDPPLQEFSWASAAPFCGMGIISLRGIEDARKIVSYAFSDCKDLRTIAVLARCMRCGMRWRRTFECEQKERAPLTLCQSFG